MDQFIGWLHGGPAPQTAGVLLTFDGRDPRDFEGIVPVLESFNLPATFFPVSWWLTDELGDMAVQCRSALRELAKRGYTIGCHSHTHQDLVACSRESLDREVIGSKQILEEVLGQGVRAFCYPYGNWDPRVASVVQKAGFDVAFTVDLGGVSAGDHPYQLKRVPVLGEPKVREFQAYLSGQPLLSGALLAYWKVRERFWTGGTVDLAAVRQLRISPGSQ
jgi:peptidoglycan/xylan/chitin deacetylase (PgdA/CDA1 family)